MGDDNLVEYLVAKLVAEARPGLFEVAKSFAAAKLAVLGGIAETREHIRVGNGDNGRVHRVMPMVVTRLERAAPVSSFPVTQDRIKVPCLAIGLC